MKRHYLLDFFERFIHVNLQQQAMVSHIGDERKLSALQDLIESEKVKTQSALLTQIYQFTKISCIKCTARKYYSALVLLLDEILERKKNNPESYVEEIIDFVVKNIEELISFMVARFGEYLGHNDKISSTYFTHTKATTQKKLQALSKALLRLPGNKPVFDILKKDLDAFFSVSPYKHLYTFRQIYYIKELLAELKNVSGVKGNESFSALEVVFITWNYNSNSFIQYLKQKISENIYAINDPETIKEQLMLSSKLFRQIPGKPKLCFNTKAPDLYRQLDTWLAQEHYYLDFKMRSLSLADSVQKNTAPLKSEKRKVQLNLTVDQLAILLRGFEDLRVVASKSLSYLFKNIVPYLSTPGREDLSWDSMRSKSYSAEPNDKSIVIEALQQLIGRIREY